MKQLTKAQEEYFKDSKIRNENQQLKVVYHGTKSIENFDTFNNVKTEPGYWFSEDRDYAKSHGDRTLECFLNLKNPFDLEAPGNDVLLWEYAKDCFKTNDVSERQIFSNQYRDYLKDKGYDGLMWTHDGEYTIVAFEPNQIKSIDNLYPTKSDNFKDNSNEYLKENLDRLSLAEQKEISKHIKKCDKTSNKEPNRSVSEKKER